jgi:hypothetical protein
MPDRMHLRLSVLAAMVAGLIAATEVGAQLAPIELNRTCTAGSSATIVAGQNSNPNAQFPRLVTCPGDCPGAVVFNTNTALSGQFFAWEFTWTQIGKSAPSQLGLQVASDVQIEGTSPAVTGFSQPGQEESSLKLGLNDWDSRWLRSSGISSSGQSTFTYYTKPNLQARPEGAASRSGSTTSTCLLAGAGTVVTEANQALNNVVRSQAGECTVDRTLDARGRTISMTLVSGPPNLCPIGLFDITIAGDTNIDTFITPDAQITFGTSTRYCFASATGGVTCVGLP